MLQATHTHENPCTFLKLKWGEDPYFGFLKIVALFSIKEIMNYGVSYLLVCSLYLTMAKKILRSFDPQTHAVLQENFMFPRNSYIRDHRPGINKIYFGFGTWFHHTDKLLHMFCTCWKWAHFCFISDFWCIIIQTWNQPNFNHTSVLDLYISQDILQCRHIYIGWIQALLNTISESMHALYLLKDTYFISKSHFYLLHIP